MRLFICIECDKWVYIRKCTILFVGKTFIKWDEPYIMIINITVFVKLVDKFLRETNKNKIWKANLVCENRELWDIAARYFWFKLISSDQTFDSMKNFGTIYVYDCTRFMMIIIFNLGISCFVGRKRDAWWEK